MTSGTSFGVVRGYSARMALYRNEYRIESSRLLEWDYASRGWYFVTICTLGWRSILGHVAKGNVVLSQAGGVANTELEQLSRHYHHVELDCWIVMPNHVHAVVVIEGDHAYSPAVKPSLHLGGPNRFPANSPRPGSLSAVVRSYKAAVVRKCRLAGLEFWWQPRFYDKILRSDASVRAVRDYIQKNPENWGKDPDRDIGNNHR